MSNWIPIAEADINTSKLAPLVSALRTAALAQNQPDPLPEYIEAAVKRIRSEISNKSSNRMDADLTTIPNSFKDLACRMIVRRMKGRLEIELTQDERDDRRDDNQYLIRISKGEVPIDTPDAPTAPEVERGGASMVISGGKSLTGNQVKGF